MNGNDSIIIFFDIDFSRSFESQFYFSGNYNVNSFHQRTVIPSNNLFLQKEERIVSPDELDLYHQFLFGKNWYIEQYPRRRKPRCTTYICS